MALLDKIASPNIADPRASFEEGRQIGEQRLTKELAGSILSETLGSKVGLKAYQDLQRVNPGAAQELKGVLGTERDEDNQYFIGLTATAAKIIEGGGTAEDVAKYLGPQIMLTQKSGSTALSQKIATAVQSLKDPATSEETVRNIIAASNAFGGKNKSADQQSFESLIKGFSKADKKKAHRVKAGLEARAVGSATQTITTKDIVDEIAATEQTLAGAKASGSQVAQIASDMFKKIEPIKTQIGNYDDAIAALDDGAESGPIMSKLPSVRASAIALDNAQKQLGLNVIQNTTFGALSEGEMALALDTALPKNLEPLELRDWLSKRREAQSKMLTYVESAASYLSIPGSTIRGFIDDQKQSASSAPALEKPGFTLMEDANGNRAYVGPNGEVEPI